MTCMMENYHVRATPGKRPRRGRPPGGQPSSPGGWTRERPGCDVATGPFLSSMLQRLISGITGAIPAISKLTAC